MRLKICAVSRRSQRDLQLHLGRACNASGMDALRWIRERPEAVNDPQIDRILQEAKDDGDGRVIVFLALISVLALAFAAYCFVTEGRVG